VVEEVDAEFPKVAVKDELVSYGRTAELGADLGFGSTGQGCEIRLFHGTTCR